MAHLEAVTMKLRSDSNDILSLGQAQISRFEEIQWVKRDIISKQNGRQGTKIWMNKNLNRLPYKFVEGPETAFKIRAGKKMNKPPVSSTRTEPLSTLDVKKKRNQMEDEDDDTESSGNFHHESASLLIVPRKIARTVRGNSEILRNTQKKSAAELEDKLLASISTSISESRHHESGDEEVLKIQRQLEAERKKSSELEEQLRGEQHRSEQKANYYADKMLKIEQKLKEERKKVHELHHHLKDANTKIRILAAENQNLEVELHLYRNERTEEI